MTARLALGDGSSLYLGFQGLREIVRDVGPPIDAPTLRLEDFGGARRDGAGRLLFVTFEGSVLAGPDPLGPLETLHRGPLPARAARVEWYPVACGEDHWQACDAPNDFSTFHWLTAGREAFVGVTKDGLVVRSSDAGASWPRVGYAPGKPFGRPFAVELDATGTGLLLHLPQRLFLTHDDGATWKEIATPGIGARWLVRDGADRIWLMGRTGHARLDGDRLTVTTDTPAPLFTAPAPDAAKEPRERRNIRRVMAGDRVVELAEVSRDGQVQAIEVTSAALGETAREAFTHPSLVTGGGLSRHVAGFGAELVYLRHDHAPAPAARTTTVLRSHDGGATFREDGKLEGAEPLDDQAIDVAVGPDGWTFVAALHPGNSTHEHLKMAGGAAFEDMIADDGMRPVAFAFDHDRDRVYALGMRGARLRVYESPLSQNHFVDTSLLEVGIRGGEAMTVDDQGTLRMMRWDGGRSVWALHRRRATGEILPVLYIPIRFGTIALAGAHGLIFAGNLAGWQTSDGGETWTPTEPVATSSLRCAEVGCLVDDGVARVGWDLPTPLTAGEPRVVASPEPPAKQAPPAAEAAPVTTSLACKPAGASATIDTWPAFELVDRAEVRWSAIGRDLKKARSWVVSASGARTREQELLPAATPPKLDPSAGSIAIINGERVIEDGVVAARVRVSTDPGGRPRPLDVELAWWSAAKGHVHRATLHGIPAFPASYGLAPYGFVGSAKIVDGGLLYQPGNGREAYYASDDGKVTMLTIPEGASVLNAGHVGTSWILADAYHGNAQLFWSSDGKAWSRKDWGLEISGSVRLGFVADRPMLTFTPERLASLKPTGPSIVLPLTTAPANDPPEPIAVDSSRVDEPCEGRLSSLRDTLPLSSSEPGVLARVEAPGSPTLRADGRIVHTTEKGALCTSAYGLRGVDPKAGGMDSAFLYRDLRGWSGWWFHRAPDAKMAPRARPAERPTLGVLATPIACAALSEPKP